MTVFVLDKRKELLMPCSEKRARLLLTRGRAVVVRRYPFTIRLKDRVGGEVQPVRIKIDPGSKTSGIAVVTDEDGNTPAKVLRLFELSHRGRQISQALTAPRAFRRRRRGANLRYRAPRFANRRKSQGWLAPSLRHRIGRVAVRASGSFTMGNADGINAKCCKILHRADRFGYGWRPALSARPERRDFQRGGF